MTEAQHDPQKGARFIASSFRLVVLERKGDEVVCEYHDGGGGKPYPKDHERGYLVLSVTNPYG